MPWKTKRLPTLRNAISPTFKRNRYAGSLLALGSLLAAGIVAGRVLRRFRSGVSRTAPLPVHHMRESLEYRAPVERVFRYWTAFSDFPRNLKAVAWARETGRSRFRFGLLKPAGGLAVWEIIVTRLVPCQYLEWYSTSRSQVQCSGRARFRSRPDACRVDVQIESGPDLEWMVGEMERFFKEELPARLEAVLSEESQSRPA